MHDTFMPPWGRSPEYCLVPITLQKISPPRRRNTEQTDEIILGTCPTIVDAVVMTLTAKGSWLLPISLLQVSCSPTGAGQTS